MSRLVLSIIVSASFTAACVREPPSEIPGRPSEPDEEITPVEPAQPAPSDGEPDPMGPPPKPPVLEALKAFGDCMTLADWTTHNMQQVADQQCTYLNNANNQCKGCHSVGEGQGLNWMDEPTDPVKYTEAFEKMREPFALFNLITWSDKEEDIVQSYRWRDKGTEAGGHPTYTLDAANANAIEEWFAVAKAKWQQGPCVP